jgi:hypothetical protein
MKHFLFSLCTILVWHTPSLAPALTITEPGVYTLGGDIFFAPGVADTALLIQSSDVVLDFANNEIIQTDSTAGVDGIRIAPGLKRISIKNGIVRNFTGHGIAIDVTTQSEKIAISDLLFDTCQTSGITITGASTLSDASIERCTFSNCILTAVGSSVLNLTGSRMIVKDILITTENSAGSAVGTTKNPILLQNIASSLFESIRILNFSAQTAALSIISTTGTVSENVFSNITADTCQSPATVTIFNATAGFGNNIISSLVAQTTISGTGAVFITVNSATNPNLFIGCINLNMSTGSGQSVGFNFTSCSNQTVIDSLIERMAAKNNNCTPYSCTGCTNLQFIRCSAFNNTATGSSTQQNSFSFDSTSTGCIVRDCIAGNNTATGTSATSRGFFFNNSTECIAEQNSAYRNIGTGTSIGFVRGATTNAFILNIALRNGTTTANQFSGFGASQFNTVAIASVNSITQPFTNAGLI